MTVKTIFFACVMVFFVANAFANGATISNERVNARSACMNEWTPFALTVCGPVGLPWGDWNVKGLHLGIINSTYEFSGLQIGGINITDRAYGLQLGFVNIITTDDCPFLPVFNWSF